MYLYKKRLKLLRMRRIGIELSRVPRDENNCAPSEAPDRIPLGTRNAGKECFFFNTKHFIDIRMNFKHQSMPQGNADDLQVAQGVKDAITMAEKF